MSFPTFFLIFLEKNSFYHSPCRIFAITMTKKISIFAALVACISIASAQFPEINCYHNDPGAHERNRNIDVSHMLVEVSFNPAQKQVFGVVTHTFSSLQNNTDTIFFDAPGIKINKVWLDNKEIGFRTNSEGLICQTNLKNDFKKVHIVKIDYNATPAKGIYFIGWNVPQIEDPANMSRRQIWTQGQGIDNRHWIPMIDDRGDKFITETKITFQSDYNVLSNGNLVSKTIDAKDKSKTTWHYKMPKPHAGYLLMLAIDKYAVKSTKTKRGTPMNLWYYPEHPERVEPTNLYSEKIIEFLEDEIGVPYQWGSYSQVMVQDFLYGAMENTSATIFGDFFWVDKRSFLDKNYIGVNAHEATHQWFGDLITGRHDGEQWLQESFATFYPGLFNGSAISKSEMDWYFRGQMLGAIAAGKANSLPVRHSQAGSSRHYPKGASVLYMLQHLLGRDNFRRSIQLYLERNMFATVETWDLQKAIVDATGINMDWFFDQWIHRGGEPKLKVSTQNAVQNGENGIEFTVEQVQKVDPVVGVFKMPTDIAIYFKDGSVHRQTVMIDKAFQKFFVPTKNKEIAFKLYDEGSFILKEIEFTKSPEELMAQLAKAENMLDRYDALVALKGFNSVISNNENLSKAYGLALMNAWQTETYKEMRTEIANQFLNLGNLPLSMYTQIATDKITEVRRAFVNKAPINEETKGLFETALTDSSYITIEAALMKMWNHQMYQNKHNTLLDKIKTVNGYTNNIKVRYCELASETYPDMKGSFIGALVSMSSDKYEFRTRILAMQALQRLNFLNDDLVLNLFEGMTTFNSRLNSPAIEVATYFNKQTQYARLFAKVLQSYSLNATNEAQKANEKKIRRILGY